MNHKLSIMYQEAEQWYYYRPRAEKLYQIPSEKLILFQAFRQRLVISLAVGAVVYSFYPESWILALFAGVLFYLLATTHFHQKLLPGLLLQQNLNWDEFSVHQKQGHTTEPAKLLLAAIAGVIVIVAAFFVTNEPLNRAIIILFGLAIILSVSQQLNA